MYILFHYNVKIANDTLIRKKCAIVSRTSIAKQYNGKNKFIISF